MSARGHEPVRTCIVCTRKGPKWSLLRIAADCERETAFLDPLQRAPGRGAYVCPQCLPRLHFTRRVQKAFRNRVRALTREERTPDTSHRTEERA